MSGSRFSWRSTSPLRSIAPFGAATTNPSSNSGCISIPLKASPISAATMTSSARASSWSCRKWLAPVSSKNWQVLSSSAIRVRSCGVTSSSRSSIIPRRKRVNPRISLIASSVRTCSASFMIFCARLRKISPAGVNKMGRALRCNSVTPIAPSRLVSCWLTAEGLAPRRRAAAVMERSSAVAINTSTPQRVIRPALSAILHYLPILESLA